MAKRKLYAILGLGVFGSTLAKDLSNYNQDVIAIDKDMSAVERVSEYVENTICLDFTDPDELRSSGVGDADVAIVATGSLLEESVLGILNLKELGVPKIIAKAKNSRFSQVFKKIGADVVVSPEKEIARRFAKQLVSGDILELFDLDESHSIFDMNVKKEWIGKTLIELELRARFNLNVIGVRRDGNLNLNPDPNDPFKPGDQCLMIGDNQIFKKIDEIDEVK